ncbi:MAG: hypothetical protein HY862_08995 [Chloroflexi bacterium]|nr:hypothetical protein [Chloroflexota bacterium]
MNNSEIGIDRFHEIELEKTLDSIASLQNLRVQIASFLGTVNLSILGVSFSSQQAGLLVIAGLVLFLFIYEDIIARSFIIMYYFKYLQIKGKYAPKDDLTDIFFSDTMWKKLYAILEIKTRREQTDALRHLSRNHWTLTGFGIPLLGGIFEILLGVTLWQFFDWNLF